MIMHTVLAGESVFSIAQKYKVPMARVISDNELVAPARLGVGQTLVIRYPKQYHIVEPGDTLASIAAMHGTTENELYRLNPSLNGLPQLTVGQSVMVSLSQPKLGKLAVNGYAYPDIDRAVLRKTLPYLTYLSIFSHGFDAQGNLQPIEDAPLTALAHAYGTKPLLTLASRGESGAFSGERAHALLQNEAAQGKLIEQLARYMTQKGYAGLNLDFEYLPTEDADALAAFVRRAAERMDSLGFELFVMLAPKTSAVQRGLPYEAHDYAALGDAADGALLMTYNRCGTHSAPGAIAPLDKVRETVQYAVSEIPPRKLFLGIPNYGCDWTLPYVQGKSAAHCLATTAAAQQAVTANAATEYDSAAQSPHYAYWRGRLQHEVWFENGRSVQEKMALAAQNGLRGVSVWQLAQWFPQLWLVLSSLYDLEKAM